MHPESSLVMSPDDWLAWISCERVRRTKQAAGRTITTPEPRPVVVEWRAAAARLDADLAQAADLELREGAASRNAASGDGELSCCEEAFADLLDRAG